MWLRRLRMAVWRGPFRAAIRFAGLKGPRYTWSVSSQASGSGSRLFFDVLQTLREQLDDVVVVEGVVNEAAVAAGAHEAHGAQQPQLMRHGRLREAEGVGERLHTPVRARQSVKHPHRGRAPQGRNSA